MTINHDKDYQFYVIICAITIIAVLLTYVYGCEVSFWVAFLVNSPAILIAALGLVSYGRTFILSENGCTVRFLNYQKHYSWDELKTKRIEQYDTPDLFGGRASCPYSETVIMAPYVIHKPSVIRPLFYSCFHPLSCIYINFTIKNGNFETGRHYEIEKEVFMLQMKKWGVSLSSLSTRSNRTGDGSVP